MTAADGLVTTVRDLARFDSAIGLDRHRAAAAARDAAHRLEPDTGRNGLPSPMGLGWFVQFYRGERVGLDLRQRAQCATRRWS
jgi:hypothetical protein